MHRITLISRKGLLEKIFVAMTVDIPFYLDFCRRFLYATLIVSYLKLASTNSKFTCILWGSIFKERIKYNVFPVTWSKFLKIYYRGLKKNISCFLLFLTHSADLILMWTFKPELIQIEYLISWKELLEKLFVIVRVGVFVLIFLFALKLAS